MQDRSFERGELVAGRFEIERRAATGGMAVVFRAIDRSSGRPAALKAIGAGDPHRWGRFAREVKVLAELEHPGIVRYLAHGITPGGHRYLAMEWLEGEDLSERLLRAPLGIEEALVLARRVAEALGFAHARGVVHRDVKPSNLFLVDGRVDQVKVLDFGIARFVIGEGNEGEATRAGVRIGTPAYMSPERARGIARLDARADVFSLGCVLFESLAGRKAFQGDDPMGVLAKILLEEPPRVGELRAGVPPAVEALVARMLSKDPERRPAEGIEVAAELEALGGGAQAGGRPRPVETALGSREQRLMSVLLARDVRRDTQLIRRIVGDFGARLEALSDGSVLASVGGSGAATDLATTAARCALAMRRALPEAPIALATGRAVVSMRFPVGDVIDRAVRMLRAARSEDPTQLARGGSKRRAGGEVAVEDEPAALPVYTDEVTAGLLDARFDVGGDDVGLVLRGERDPPSPPARTLLGRPTPCVGRDAELAMLDAMYEAAAGDPGARALLVTAPAGVGKSRLRHEFVRRLEARGAAAQVWIARGDPMSAGAPFGLIGSAVRRAAGILESERLDLRRRKLRARVGRHLHPDDATRVAEFIGELVGTPFPADQSVQLRTALTDAQLLGDQMRRAWEDWLAAETDARPLVLVLEDLQWGDHPTVTFVDAALRHLRERPFLVLGLARPEVHDLFPRLWVDRGVQEIRLAELPRRASERLVRQVLGDRASEATVQRLAARAAGNAFYLEELIRAAAEGRGDELPETVLAMVQARLQALDAPARRVLRAASVFGRLFTADGVRALLGGGESDAELARLVDEEWLTPRGDGAHGFRHGLLRDAAYATLTDGDRALGHRLAAAWLEAAGEPDALVLAEHLERGGEAERAIACYLRAAEQALGGNDLAAVATRVARAVSLGAAGPALGKLRLIEAEALRWRGELASAEKAALEALRWLPRAGDDWYLAAEEAAYASGTLGDRDRLVELATLLGDLPGDDASAAQVRAALRLAVQLTFAGRPDLGDRISAAIDGATSRFENSDPAIAGRILAARASRAHFAGDQGLYLELLEQAVERFERAGDLRGACLVRGSAGWAFLEVGDYARGESTVREVLATAERLGLANVAATAKQNLGLALLHQGRLDEARAVEDDSCRMFVDSGNRRMEATSRGYLALILLRAGDRRGAERKARGALEVSLAAPPLLTCQAEGYTVLARVLLEDGRTADARDAAARAVAILDSLGGIDGGESTIRLVHAEALHAVGEKDAARAAIASARDRLLARAGRIPSEELRASFLQRVSDNARTLALADAWLARDG